MPDIAMCFSDERFAYGPFPPHYVPRQYLENYVALHKLDKHLVLNTTVEDLSRIPSFHPEVSSCRWRLTLRKHDVLRRMDIWWTEIFDAVVIANGHYAVPFVRCEAMFIAPLSPSPPQMLMTMTDPTCRRIGRISETISRPRDPL